MNPGRQPAKGCVIGIVLIHENCEMAIRDFTALL